jgi:S-adenosylmethionine uptake transporter
MSAPDAALTARPIPSSLSGALLALAGWAAFSLQDAIVKLLVTDLPVPEVLFGRSIVIVLISALVVRRADYRAMAVPRNAFGIALRAALILVAWLAYYSASRSLQLAELVTYYFAAPLFVVALSAPLLREYVGPGRWLATGVGFAGVLIAAHPGGGAPIEPVALALLAAVTWAMTTILARGLAKGISTPAMMLGGAIGFVVVCGAMLPSLGVWPNFRQIAIIAALGCVGATGQFFWFEGVRRAQASLLAPLEYSMLAYAIFWGWLFFSDLPSARTLIGAAIVLASGLLMMGIEIGRRRSPREAL